MAYQKIKSHKMSEKEFRQLWKEVYCDPQNPIKTFDSILVKFYESMFDHAFFESANRKAKDKSILSLNRLEKMLWIKDVLTDPGAILKQGWIKDKKIYDNNRRVAFIKDSYVVIVRFTGVLKASFITAYEIQSDENINHIKNSPDWIRDNNLLGKV